MSFSNRPPDDADDEFDDPSFVNDRFEEPAAPTRGVPADPYGAEPYGADPYEVEDVIIDDSQNVPNSYNVRNILLLATGLFVVLLAAFLWSISDPNNPDEVIEVVPTTADGSLGASAPADLLGAGSPPPEDDLAALLNDPNVANGGSGAYGTYSDAPPRTTSTYSEPADPYETQASPDPDGGASVSAGPAGPREPSYYDRRREAYYAALGLGSRESIGARGAAAAQGGYDEYGNYSPSGAGQGGFGSAGQGGYGGNGAGGNGLTLASAQLGQGGQAGSQAGGASSGSGAARRPGPPNLAPSSSFRQATTAANAPFAPFTLAQGTLVPVVLETAVSSDIQGVFIARTVEDVYDRTRRHVLIPRGSQVVSSYQNAEAVGDRLQAEASRLNLPDGRSVDFGGTGLFDSQGRQGLRDRVNRHTASRVGAGALLTIVGIASSVGQRRAERDVILVPNADGSVTQVPVGTDVQNEAISRAGQGAERAISQRADRVLNRPNTILLRPGLRGTLILQQDVDMRRPYYDAGGSVPVGRSPFDARRPRPSPAETRTASTPRTPQPGAPTRTSAGRAASALDQ